MADNIADLVQVTFIYDATLGSAIEQQPLGGTKYGLPKSVIPLPQQGVLFGQSGFSRQLAGAWEWVLQGQPDVLDTFVDGLTGRGGWTVPASRVTMKSLCQALQRQGFTRTQIQNQVPQLYAAIKTEVLAEPPL